MSSVLNSMTAFARHAFTLALPAPDADTGALASGASPRDDAGIALSWELRTVNHRFFEAAFRLPDDCRDLEPGLREEARAVLARGRLDATLRLQERARAPAPRIDAEALKALLFSMRELQSLQPGLAPPTALELLRWPGVLKEPRPDDDALHARVREGFRAALDALVAGRAREGAALQRVLGDRLQQIRRIVVTVREDTRQVPNQLQARLRARLADLDANAVDPQRLAQEVALLAQRADVAEELDRLDAHLLEFERAFAQSTPVGRHLDFLAQELAREANTLSSKAPNSGIAQRGIELKVLVEQIREQVQNVE